MTSSLTKDQSLTDEDAAEIGRAFMERLPPGYGYNDCPTEYVTDLENKIADLGAPVPMLLWCPGCGDRHIDVGEFAAKVHHTHACQSCGMVWRPAVVPTVGVQWLPGFKNDK